MSRQSSDVHAHRDANSTAPGFVVVAAVGLWFALASGLIEVVGLVAEKYMLGEVINRSEDFLWMTPVGYLLLFGGPAIGVAILSQALPASLRLRLATFAFAFAAVMGQLVTWVGFHIHPLAQLMLAIGAAAAVSGNVASNPALFYRLVRTTGAAGLVALLALGGFCLTRAGVRVATEFSGVAAPSRDRPNVLLLILDTVGASHLSVYGYPRETTPRLDAWASQAVVFDRAVSPAPWTLPSHASMFTGLPASELSATWKVPLDDAHPTVAEVLREAGYATGAFVANRSYTTFEWGLARGFGRFEDYRRSLGAILRHAGAGERIFRIWSLRPLVGTDQAVGRKTATHVTDDLLEWLEKVDDRPFFAFVNFFDAHDPYLPPEEWKERFEEGRAPSRLSPYRRYSYGHLAGAVTEDDVAAELDAYDGSIAYIDNEIGRLFDTLRERDLLSNTIVIVSADHGELFGEHGLYQHGRTLYSPELLVPLMIAAPSAPVGTRIDGTVSLTDLAATILDLAGLEHTLPGESLARYWTGNPKDGPGYAVSSVREMIRMPNHYPAARSNMTSWIRGPWHYIAQQDGQTELFNLDEDPGELANLVNDPSARTAAGLDTVAGVATMRSRAR